MDARALLFKYFPPSPKPRVTGGRSLGLCLSLVLFAGAAFSDPAPAAYWAFDEAAGTAAFSAGPGAEGWTATAEQPPARRRGVAGGALALRGAHGLRTAGFRAAELPAVTLCAWVRPSELGGYREILRQECDSRVLFSFQENGTILSLGLDVNGYAECDGRIAPEQALDGVWHFCAASFDGQSMRVWFDGAEIGAMERPGTIRLCPDAPLFIGSMGGTAEHFQGGLDEVRIFTRALSREELEGLFRAGLAELEKASRELTEAASDAYAEEPTFAETMAQTRSRIAGRRGGVDDDLAEAVLGRIRARFPDAYGRFMECADGTPPLDYLTERGGDPVPAQTERLIALLTEYKPLTEHQTAAQTEDDRRWWAEADRLQGRFDALAAHGEDPAYASAWIDLMLAVGGRVRHRPRMSEPVAPYVRPETPETRALDPEAAREALRRDWLHQADGRPAPARIRDEIRWARELAARIGGDFSRALARLDALEARAARLDGPDRGLYFEVRETKREIMLANPVVDFDQVLLVDMPYPAGSEWQHETRHRLGYMAVPGARLLLVRGLHPGGEPVQLMPQPPLHGSFWRPDLSFDAKRVLFCFKPHNEKSFHLYEINLDGTGLRQLTDGPYDDVDPVWLPDGHIMFATTRGHNYVRCMPPTNSFQLARADGDGKNVYLVSYSNEPDYLPSVMDDGRVVYTRWEYTDKPLWRAQKLWTTNPDGTQVVTLWGNQSVWPDVMKDARNIPGTRRVMFTGSAHHNWFAGSVGIIDPDRGLNFPKGLTKVTADVEWPECGNGPVDPVESPAYHASGDYSAYYSPFPLGPRDFLVSARRGGKDDRFRLYLMDTEGNRELIHEGARNIFHALPVRPRPVPPVLADRVAWPQKAERDAPKPGVIFSGDVCQNAPPELRGKVKFLRVLQIDAKTYTYWNRRPYISTGPVVSAVQSEGVKRVLGTVPVEADGSVAFYAPPGQALHFQLLDENQRALQTMRSFTGVMPGESRGCLGCHESHSRTPAAASKPAALNRAPSEITPLPWADNTVSWHRYVRPVLDRHCARCHTGGGEGQKTLDMTERPSPPVFSEPYMTLIGRPSWGAPYAPPEKPEPGFGIAGVMMVEAYGQLDPKAYATPKPMTSLSYKSPLIAMVSEGKHHGVKVEGDDLLRLILWVDAMCPYLGDEEVRAIPDPEFQGIDWLAVRPRIKTAPVISRPGPVD